MDTLVKKRRISQNATPRQRITDNEWMLTEGELASLRNEAPNGLSNKNKSAMKL